MYLLDGICVYSIYIYTFMDMICRKKCQVQQKARPYLLDLGLRGLQSMDRNDFQQQTYGIQIRPEIPVVSMVWMGLYIPCSWGFRSDLSMYVYIYIYMVFRGN